MLILTVRDCYTEKEAETIVYNTDRRVNIVKTASIYYPYYRLRYRLVVGGKFWSKLNKLSDCVIDLVDGRAAEVRGEPVYHEIEVDERDVVGIKIPKEECYKRSHDFVLKLYLNKAKLLHVPGIEIISEELFYKKFYIIHCKDKEEMDYFLMVDAIEGEMSILDS